MATLPVSFLRRYGDRADFVAKCLIGTYGHLALAVAADIYDSDGELQQHERDLLTDIRAADARRSASLALARQAVGFGTTTYLATERLASNQRDDDYQRALDKYEMAVEAMDEVDEIEFTPSLMAAE